MDKRNSTRQNPIGAVFVCRPFTSSGPDHTASAVMRNYSDNGSYVESSRSFHLGTILHLRMVKYPKQASGLPVEIQPRSVCLAEVKWRQELAGHATHRYGLGLKTLG